jgi:polyhydroxyalkanoate synthesis regulator protein
MSIILKKDRHDGVSINPCMTSRGGMNMTGQHSEALSDILEQAQETWKDIQQDFHDERADLFAAHTWNPMMDDISQTVSWLVSVEQEMMQAEAFLQREVPHCME